MKLYYFYRMYRDWGYGPMLSLRNAWRKSRA